jgi:hypothetical protein
MIRHIQIPQSNNVRSVFEEHNQEVIVLRLVTDMAEEELECGLTAG